MSTCIVLSTGNDIVMFASSQLKLKTLSNTEQFMLLYTAHSTFYSTVETGHEREKKERDNFYRREQNIR